MFQKLIKVIAPFCVIILDLFYQPQKQCCLTTSAPVCVDVERIVIQVVINSYLKIEFDWCAKVRTATLFNLTMIYVIGIKFFHGAI